MSRPTGWVRLGINAEKPTLESGASFYDGLTIPAHVYALYRNSLAQSIVSWKKPFFIDPMTHIFFLDRKMIRRPGDGRIRKSYEKLAEYSPEAKYFLAREDLAPETMPKSEMRSFVHAIVQMTLQIQTSGAGGEGSPKRLKSLTRIRKHMGGAEEELPLPKFLVTPYFYLKDIGTPVYQVWLETVKAFESMASTSTTELPIFRAVCVSSAILEHPRKISALIQELSDAEGVLLWVDDFEKCGPETDLLEGFANLIKGLSDSGCEVLSLYGGYLTAVFFHSGLSGLSFGLNAGDSKAVDSYSTGGGAPARYYDPNLHTFITASEVLTYYGGSISKARLFNCNCNVCEPVSAALSKEENEFETTSHLAKVFIPKKSGRVSADWGDMRSHFLHVRNSELEFVGQHRLSYLVDDAKSTLSEMPDLPHRRTGTLECVARIEDML